MVIREVELGRRAAAGGRGRRVREKFADWEPRRLKNRGGVLGAWKTGAWEDTGDPGRHMGISGAGRELESPGRTEEETQELENAKREKNELPI